MRHENELLIRTLLLAAVVLALASPPGLAAPADVHVRIEGVHATLFDRVVRSDGHAVRAASDPVSRPCDGTNAGAHAAPGPTATAATVDALATRGLAFDGQWHAGYEDYFMRELGGEREDNGALWWWGIVVDGAFSPTGGCQRRVADGDEVLWANDAFSGRPFLWLAGAAPTPTVEVGEPLTVTVTSSNASGGGASGTPYAGAPVQAVDANGQPAAAGVADGAASAADGSAVVIFHASGWQRLKARGPANPSPPPAAPLAIASDSLDVCVEPALGAGCAGAPPSRVAVLPPASGPGPGPGGDPPPSGPGPIAGPPTIAPPAAPPARPRPAWMRRLAAGAQVRVRLAAGRPAFALRLGARGARVELRAGGRRRLVTLAPGRAGRVRTVRAPRLASAGWVQLRVLRGVVRVEGVRRAR